MLKKAVGLGGALVLQALDHPVQLNAISPLTKSFSSLLCAFLILSHSSRAFMSQSLKQELKEKPCVPVHSFTCAWWEWQTETSLPAPQRVICHPHLFSFVGYYSLSLSLSHTKVQGANASWGLARTIKLKWTKKMGVWLRDTELSQLWKWWWDERRDGTECERGGNNYLPAALPGKKSIVPTWTGKDQR